MSRQGGAVSRHPTAIRGVGGIVHKQGVTTGKPLQTPNYKTCFLAISNLFRFCYISDHITGLISGTSD
jgi:hypothetical protein